MCYSTVWVLPIAWAVAPGGGLAFMCREDGGASTNERAGAWPRVPST